MLDVNTGGMADYAPPGFGFLRWFEIDLARLYFAPALKWKGSLGLRSRATVTCAEARSVARVDAKAPEPQPMKPSRPTVHPAVAAAQEAFYPDLVEEVAKAVSIERVVVVGVSGLPPGRRARRMLDATGIAYRYLEYGSYFSGWQRRLALKIWVGWPTFPLVFVKGTFIGGASDLRKLIESGEFKRSISD